MAHIKIGDKVINQESPAYIIAEIGVNHEGSIEKAFELIELAWQGGADAVKFQTYKAETLASRNSPYYWDLNKESTKSQYELFRKYDCFGQPEYELLANYCQKIGIHFLSTPFDERAVEFLSPLMPCIKIASADITNFPLLRKIAAQKKPVILSTGASSLAEIAMAIAELEKSGCESLALLHCVLNYPTAYENANLNMIKSIKRVFSKYIVGYSDHTIPDEKMLILSAAYFMGARIIEKHFTKNKLLPGNDHYHAMDIEDLKCFKANMALIRKAEGQYHKVPLEEEMPAVRNARRSIVLKQKADKGTKLTEEMLICKRPAFGISPIYWYDIIGKEINKDLSEDHILQWSDICD